MAKAATKSKETNVADVDLDALLGDLDLDEPTVGAATESSELDDILGELELEDAGADISLDSADLELEEILAEVEEPTKDNSELYQDDEPVSTKAEAAPATKKKEVAKNKAKAKKAKADESKAKPEPDVAEKKKPAKKAATKTAKVDMTLPMSEIIKAKLGESGKNLLVIEDDVKLDAATIDAMPKKVKEKLLNLFMHLHNGVALSTYTVRALEVLDAKSEASNALIQENYLEKGWSKGTSSSQAGQLVRLLKDLKICNMSGKTLTPNEKSRLLPLLSNKETEA